MTNNTVDTDIGFRRIKGTAKELWFLVANVIKLQTLTKFTFLARNQSIWSTHARTSREK